MTAVAPSAVDSRRESLLRALGRPERDLDLSEPLGALRLERVLVTGAAGEIGQPLVGKLLEHGVQVIPTDIAGASVGRPMDVTKPDDVRKAVLVFQPTLIINLAAAKLAPAGEIDPWAAATVNINGVMNLLNTGVRVVQASTCKAVEPQTCYGASKLIAERMVLNAGGTVVRYVNVPEAGPSMVSTWEQLPADEPIPVTSCHRYVMTLGEAIGLTIWGAVLPPGRYKLDAGRSTTMRRYAARYFPGRKQVGIELRRGDRLIEPFCGNHEHVRSTKVPWIEQVVGNGDA